MRLKAEIWVQAYIRRCYGGDAAAVVVHRGDPDAGAIFIKINSLDGFADVYGPAPQGIDMVAYERQWCASFGGERRVEADADDYLMRQRELDADVWVIEVEDRDGRHFLDDALVVLE